MSSRCLLALWDLRGGWVSSNSQTGSPIKTGKSIILAWNQMEPSGSKHGAKPNQYKSDAKIITLIIYTKPPATVADSFHVWRFQRPKGTTKKNTIFGSKCRLFVLVVSANSCVHDKLNKHRNSNALSNHMYLHNWDTII